MLELASEIPFADVVDLINRKIGLVAAPVPTIGVTLVNSLPARQGE